MYDELIKRLRGVAEEVADDYDVDPYNAEQRCFAIEQAADAIEQLSNAGSAYGRGWTLGYDAGREESKPRWIPVAERLPKTDTKVLVCSSSYPAIIATGFRDSLDGLFRSAWDGETEIVEVDYWMQLPEMPKEE